MYEKEIQKEYKAKNMEKMPLFCIWRPSNGFLSGLQLRGLERRLGCVGDLFQRPAYHELALGCPE